MNIFFSVILILGVGILVFTNPEAIMPALMDGANDGLQFVFKLFVIYAVWLSVLKILEKSGADKGVAKLFNPVSKLLFKDESDKTLNYINLNMSLNLLGMGGAATPMGIKAMENLKNKKNKVMLMVINSSSIQLIPTTILAMRADLSAKADIILPSLIVNIVTTVVGIILVKVFVR